MENVSSSGTHSDPSTWATLESQATTDLSKYTVQVPDGENCILDMTFNLYTSYASVSDIDYPAGVGVRLFDADGVRVREAVGYWTFRSGDGCSCRVITKIDNSEGITSAKFIWNIQPVGAGIVKWGYDFYEPGTQVSWVTNGNAIAWNLMTIY